MNEHDQDPDDMKVEGETFEKAAQSYLGGAGAKKLQAPKKTWFFQVGYNPKNSRVIAVEEREAWDIVNNKSEWKRRDFILIGTSDGKKYNEVVKEAQKMAEILMPQIRSLSAKLKSYIEAEQKLVIDEVVDEDDLTDEYNAQNVAKLKRLRKMIDKTRTELSEKKTEYRETVGKVVIRANEAELKVAKANMKKYGADWPSASNVITPAAAGKDRKKILKVMGQSDE